MDPNPATKIFQISVSDSCSDSGYNRYNPNSPMFFFRKDNADSSYYTNRLRFWCQAKFLTCYCLSVIVLPRIKK